MDVVAVINPVSGFCTQILYNFNPMFLVSNIVTTRLLIVR